MWPTPSSGRPTGWSITGPTPTPAARWPPCGRSTPSLAGSPDLARRAAVKSRLTSFLSWGTGELAAAAAAAEEAIVLHREAGQPTQARLAELELAYARGLAGEHRRRSTTGRPDAGRRPAAGDEDAALWAIGVRGTTAFYQGHFAEADAALRDSISLARQQDKPYRVTWGLMSLGWSLGYEGRADRGVRTPSSRPRPSPAGGNRTCSRPRRSSGGWPATSRARSSAAATS